LQTSFHEKWSRLSSPGALFSRRSTVFKRVASVAGFLLARGGSRAAGWLPNSCFPSGSSLSLPFAPWHPVGGRSGAPAGSLPAERAVRPVPAVRAAAGQVRLSERLRRVRPRAVPPVRQGRPRIQRPTRSREGARVRPGGSASESPQGCPRHPPRHRGRKLRAAGRHGSRNHPRVFPFRRATAERRTSSFPGRAAWRSRVF